MENEAAIAVNKTHMEQAEVCRDCAQAVRCLKAHYLSYYCVHPCRLCAMQRANSRLQQRRCQSPRHSSLLRTRCCYCDFVVIEGRLVLEHAHVSGRRLNLPRVREMLW